MGICIEIYGPMPKAVLLFTAAKRQKQPGCLLTYEKDKIHLQLYLQWSTFPLKRIEFL